MFAFVVQQNNLAITSPSHRPSRFWSKKLVAQPSRYHCRVTMPRMRNLWLLKSQYPRSMMESLRLHLRFSTYSAILDHEIHELQVETDFVPPKLCNTQRVQRFDFAMFLTSQDVETGWNELQWPMTVWKSYISFWSSYVVHLKYLKISHHGSLDPQNCLCVGPILQNMGHLDSRYRNAWHLKYINVSTTL